MSQNRLPAYLLIEGVPVHIQTDDRVLGSDGDYGVISMVRGTITICGLSPIPWQWSTLLHEILHPIADRCGVTDDQIDTIARRLFGVLRENNICFKTLTADPPALTDANKTGCDCQGGTDNPV